MTFVHGTNDEDSSGSATFYAAQSQMRHGSTTNRRDGTVWTTNFIGNHKPSETYFSRKYIITDSFQNMEDVARPLSEETFEDVAGLNDLERKWTSDPVVDGFCLSRSVDRIALMRQSGHHNSCLHW